MPSIAGGKHHSAFFNYLQLTTTTTAFHSLFLTVCRLYALAVLSALCQKAERGMRTIKEIIQLCFGNTTFVQASTQTMVVTGTICGTICEDSSPLKCESVAPFQIHTATSSRPARLQVPRRWRTNRKDHPVTDKLACCYHCWACPAALNGRGCVSRS